MNAKFGGHTIFLVLMWVLALYLVQLLGNESEIMSFDPYRILNIERGSEDGDIKKAYRRMSLQYHPDKNPGNKLAEEMFMKVAKAYEALTDETAKKNWEEFGNPDGKQALEVSIGLPTFLLEKDNHNAILMVYLFILVIVIPVIVGAWYANSKQYGENNVMYDTYSFFIKMLSEHTNVKMLPEVLSGAAEFRSINTPLQDRSKVEDMSRLNKKMREGGMQKPKFEHPIVLKGNLLLHAHLTRTVDSLSPWVKEDVTKMLQKALPLIDAMLELTQSQRWLQTSVNAIEFSQFMTQALWVKDHSLMQLPHFTEKEVGHATKGKGSVKNLAEYLRLDDEQKKGLANMSDVQRIDIMRVCAIIPALEVEAGLFVEDETEIAERDLVTCRVKFTRTNVPEGENAQPVHTPYLPVGKLEAWWAILSDKNGTLIALEKITDQSREVVHDIKFLAPPAAGAYTFNVELKSDSYLGLDSKHQVKMTVIAAAELPEFVPHPDDLELDNEPTLFEQVMAGNLDDDSEEEDDDDAAAPAGSGRIASDADGDSDADMMNDPSMAHLTEAQRRKRINRLKRKQGGKNDDDDDEGDDDDDDDEDDELIKPVDK